MIWSIGFGAFSVVILFATWRYLYLFLTKPVDFNEVNNPADNMRPWSSYLLMYGSWIGVAYMIFAGIMFVILRLPRSFMTANDTPEEFTYLVVFVGSLVASALALFRLDEHGEKLAKLER